MPSTLPTPLAAALGLVPATLDGVRALPGRVVQLPVLAVSMPAFRRELELLTQHKEIHKGMDKLEVYVDDCKAGKRDLRMEELYVNPI